MSITRRMRALFWKFWADTDEPEKKEYWIKMAEESFVFEGSKLGALLPEQISGFVYGLYEPIEWDNDRQPTQYRAVLVIVFLNGASETVPATDENIRIATEIKKLKLKATP
ncbi:hypothetical protein BPS26883_00393 [Burkholderia pseudomultivorans]|jgi:hypothetical protein|uniref:Uncharacterized protein n=2 Tax=Burkholderia pseudomultivorans TaxID=1207504 RepID=A0A6P2H6A9_9BURK|nr:hypothetical protein BPS26883_00393 [Burkholderia pseudomultivorans]